VVSGIVINAQDITDQKHLESALMRSAKRLRALMTEIFSAQETERRRLSSELHDELGQSLTALKLQLRSIANKLRKDQPGLRQDCAHMLEYINEVVENVRRLSHDLSPSLLENLGLAAGLRHLLNSFQKFYQIEENLEELEEIETLLTPQVQIHLYRIFQELLTNIEKHAQATKVTVNVTRRGNTLIISVADNGRGFPPDAALEFSYENPGIGLSAINERLLMLGGQLEIASQENGGSRIQITIPLQTDNQSY
jgi:signal transduction histidine kinase